MGIISLALALTAVLLQSRCWGLDPTNIYDLRMDQLTDGCDPTNDQELAWCLVDDDMDDVNYKCWVTSYNLCDGRRYAGPRSICRHDVSGDVKLCAMGQWRQDPHLKTTQTPKRFKRFIFGRRRTYQPPVYVPDNHPSIHCPASITQTAPSGQTSAQVHWAAPTVSDDRGTPGLVQVAGPASGSTFGASSTVIRYRATDSAGQSAECHFIVTVTVTYCPSPPPLTHGTRSCSGAGPNVYGAACSHYCETGYRLDGSSNVYCTSNGVWSSPFPSCPAVSCGPPADVPGGQVVCAQGHAYPASCVVQCDAGFDPPAPTSLSCTSNGAWNQSVACTDVQTPQFPQGCPAPQVVFSGPLSAPVAVTWTDPVVTDNGGLGGVTLTSVPAKGSALGPGSHTVTVTARDAVLLSETCQFTVTVEVKECDAVTQPTHGNVTCTAGHVEGSVCNVNCHYGYRLQGQATLECLNTEKWDAAFPVCEAVICGDLPEVSQGQWACPSGRQCPAVCTLNCAPGSRLVSPGNVTCEQEGNWTSPGLCQDIQPPVFDNGCPANLEVFAARLGQETRVNLSHPAVSDNFGDVVRLSTDVISGSVFANGVTVVTYEAADTSGNTNSCHTNVTVSVLDCGAPDLQPQSAQGPSPMQNSCPDGHVHGASCALTCLHGYRLQGQGSVTCERDDVTHPPSMTWQWSGSMAAEPRCREDTCPPLEPPMNGALSCYHGDVGWDCYMSCERSWDVPAFSDGRLVCLNERQIWSPVSAPDCVARVMPGRVRMMADLLYFTGSCNVSTDQLRNNFISHIRNTVFNGACASMPSCDAENIEVRCSSVPSRGRRNLDEDNTLMTRLHRFRRHGNMTSHFVIVTFHVTMPYVEEAVSPEEAFQSYNQSVTDCVQSYQVESHRLQSDLRAKVAAGQLDVDDLGLDLVADESSTVGEVAMHADCPPGTAYRVPRHPTRFSCLAE